MGFLNKIFGKSEPESPANQAPEKTDEAQETPAAPVSAPEPDVELKEQSATKIKERMDSGEDLILVDVRELPELEICKIDSAVHIPLSEIPARHAELPKDKPVVLHCHHGMRSQMAGYELINAGFTDVTNMTGGIHAWAAEVEPDMSQY